MNHCIFIQEFHKLHETRKSNSCFRIFLLRLSEEAELKPLLFVLFLCIYLVIFIGNTLIILAIITDSNLHIPMYLFLSNLSFSDICLTPTTISKILVNIQAQSKAIIAYAGCNTQLCFYLLFRGLDNLLLTVMAYNNLVAICHPLHYMIIMNPKLHGILLLASWLVSVLESLMILQLSFCKDGNPSFFCKLNQVVPLTCSDTFLNDLVMNFIGKLLDFSSPTGILFSYYRIITSVLGISSAEGRYKAFSTCRSHLSIVFLFYGTRLGVYLGSTTTQNFEASARASVTYTVVTPMLNPFIYSLKNKDIKQALKNYSADL